MRCQNTLSKSKMNRVVEADFFLWNPTLIVLAQVTPTCDRHDRRSKSHVASRGPPA